MGDDAVVALPSTVPLATLATVAAYERLVSEKDAEIGRLRGEVDRLARHLDSQQLSLRQAQALIAYLSERVADQAGER